MSHTFARPDLGMTEAEAQERFADLQRKLVPLWKSIQSFNTDPQTIVVVPSLTFDLPVSGSLLQAYEERFLFLLLLLRQPRARLVYVSSLPIRPELVDYYLHLLPGVISSHARKRLFMISPLDGSARPLSLKLLERPRLLKQIRSAILDPDRAHLVPFNTTILERDLALRLGVPMYGADPQYFHFGTKGGGRKIFAEEGIRYPLGASGLHTEADVAAAIMAMRRQRPDLRHVILKHDEGVGGIGNALINVEGLPAPGDAAESTAVAERVRGLQIEFTHVSYEWFMNRLAQEGGVVEERITGEVFRSPSAQMRVTPLGQLELLSTHDQLLGGPSGQSYFGCRFPADPAYAPEIMRAAAKVGERLAREGVIGRFALDFVSVRKQDGNWEHYAIEINLRKGGTTHPFLTLQFLTDGAYQAERGVFTTPMGHEKYFVASDHLESPRYRALSAEDIFNVIACNNLHFDQARQSGVVFHMMSALSEHGRVGLTAVGDSHAEADVLYQRAVDALEAEAGYALSPE